MSKPEGKSQIAGKLNELRRLDRLAYARAWLHGAIVDVDRSKQASLRACCDRAEETAEVIARLGAPRGPGRPPADAPAARTARRHRRVQGCAGDGRRVADLLIAAKNKMFGELRARNIVRSVGLWSGAPTIVDTREVVPCWWPALPPTAVAPGALPHS